jgi:hypothetical protein
VFSVPSFGSEWFWKEWKGTWNIFTVTVVVDQLVTSSDPKRNFYQMNVWNQKVSVLSSSNLLIAQG